MLSPIRAKRATAITILIVVRVITITMMIDRKAIAIKRALKKKKQRIVKKFKQRRIRSITIHGTEKSNIAIKIKKIAL